MNKVHTISIIVRIEDIQGRWTICFPLQETQLVNPKAHTQIIITHTLYQGHISKLGQKNRLVACVTDTHTHSPLIFIEKFLLYPHIYNRFHAWLSLSYMHSWSPDSKLTIKYLYIYLSIHILSHTTGTLMSIGIYRSLPTSPDIAQCRLQLKVSVYHSNDIQRRC